VNLLQCCVVAVVAPLLGAIISGFFRRQIGRVGAHSVTIACMTLSFLLSIYAAWAILSGTAPTLDVNLYTWANGGDQFPYAFYIGFLIDPLTVIMMVTVTFVSLLVHIYSIGYMADDDGYQRFFSYISLFTFMMMMLVTGNNFLQLFFGWEGVGLVSYLLIGFWYQKESALQGGA
jgi:NADH-quinone oxidoreductase subunit L